ncbi:ferredoxin--NADP reductase [Pacificimonas flava]|uniref:ferredoxin--NADP(+) reductase n=1 Tax=Pacificimonas flava TaxID=1234595 RepID=M2TS39_9SPHN|nr:ferredoxin-NADP reductase [Pacificimonas flava]MBB5279515.1 ferredoxin--NADP+ reductase [Pacificimonas flava]
MNMHSRPSVRIPAHTSFDTVQVTGVRHWNEHLFSFTAARPRSFRFRSGEFVMIGLPGEVVHGADVTTDGSPPRPVMRAYSIASPSYSDDLSFLSIKVPDGPLTARLQRVRPGDEIYLAKKPTGTLVADALLPGKRLFLLSTGTGLAPFLSVARDPDIYDMFDQIVLVHGVRRVSDLAYRAELEAKLSGDPLIGDAALMQFHYFPTVTREPFRNNGRIQDALNSGRVFAPLIGGRTLDPDSDRVMMCGSSAMIRDLSEMLDFLGFEEGANSRPGSYVLERAFVG